MPKKPGRPRASPKGTKTISITMPEEVVTKVDKARGVEKRSSWVTRVLKRKLRLK